MKGKMVLIIVITISLLIGSISGYAALKTSSGVENTFNTGGVSIKAESFTEKEGEIVPLQGITVVDAKGKASYIPRITNNAEASYVRVKMTATTEKQKINIMDNIYGISSDWKYIDGYLYYTQHLNHEETVDVCKGFNVPQNWDYMTSNDLSIEAKVDAIQAKNFMPDFTSNKPWGDVVITASNIGDDYTISDVITAEGDTIRIAYDSSSGIDINSEDFFKGVNFMPGDEYEDSFTIHNRTKKPVKIAFKTDFENSKLLKLMEMDINNGQKFYSGKIANDELRKPQLIADLNPGEKQEIDVKLSLPATADNSYQDISDMQVWYFIVEGADSAVKTGDSLVLWFITVICFCSFVISLYLIKKRGKKNEDV